MVSAPAPGFRVRKVHVVNVIHGDWLMIFPAGDRSAINRYRMVQPSGLRRAVPRQRRVSFADSISRFKKFRKLQEPGRLSIRWNLAGFWRPIATGCAQGRASETCTAGAPKRVIKPIFYGNFAFYYRINTFFSPISHFSSKKYGQSTDNKRTTSGQ